MAGYCPMSLNRNALATQCLMSKCAWFDRESTQCSVLTAARAQVAILQDITKLMLIMHSPQPVPTGAAVYCATCGETAEPGDAVSLGEQWMCRACWAVEERGRA
jgi:hypothetical protein